MQFYQVLLSDTPIFSHVSKDETIKFIKKHIEERMTELGCVRESENTWRNDIEEDLMTVDYFDNGERVCITNISGSTWWYEVIQQELHGI